MKEYIDAQLNEDSIIFSLTELATRIPTSELKQELEAYIANSEAGMEGEENVRFVEIEGRYAEYVCFILEHIRTGRTPPSHKSYSLNV